jgi:hypothetical protein
MWKLWLEEKRVKLGNSFVGNLVNPIKKLVSR